MTRVRFGLTGLAFVFLIVLLAAALFGTADRPGETGKQSETLATLGVAPGKEEAAPPPPPTKPEPLPRAPEQPDLDTIPLPPPEQEPPLATEGELTEI